MFVSLTRVLNARYQLVSSETVSFWKLNNKKPMCVDQIFSVLHCIDDEMNGIFLMHVLLLISFFFILVTITHHCIIYRNINRKIPFDFSFRSMRTNLLAEYPISVCSHFFLSLPFPSTLKHFYCFSTWKMVKFICCFFLLELKNWSNPCYCLKHAPNFHL